MVNCVSLCPREFFVRNFLRRVKENDARYTFLTFSPFFGRAAAGDGSDFSFSEANFSHQILALTSKLGPPRSWPPGLTSFPDPGQAPGGDYLATYLVPFTFMGSLRASVAYGVVLVAYG